MQETKKDRRVPVGDGESWQAVAVDSHVRWQYHSQP